MIFNLYNISCKYVKPMNCMVLGNKQYNKSQLNYASRYELHKENKINNLKNAHIQINTRV